MRHVRIIDERSPHRHDFPVILPAPDPEPRRGHGRGPCDHCRHEDCICNWWRYGWDLYWEMSPWGILGKILVAGLSLLFGPIILLALILTIFGGH